jgi:hypothetical protein
MRSVAFRKEFANDLTDPGRAFGLFTFVAATDVLAPGRPSAPTTLPH